jgi:hypothetical protein
VLASLVVKMIAKGVNSIPSVDIKQTAASLAYRLEFESNSELNTTPSMESLLHLVHT